MALLIQKLKTRILSKYSGQNSHITNISDTVYHRVLVNDRGEEVPVHNTRESISYEVFFNIDMRKLIESNAQFLEFSILNSSTKKSMRMFKMIPGQNKSDVAAALYVGTKEGHSRLVEDRRKKTRGGGMINLISHLNDTGVNNNYYNNKKTDEELFGKIKSISIVDPEKIKSRNQGMLRIAQFPVSVMGDQKVSTNIDFIETYRDTIDNNIDPGSAFKPIQNIKNVSPKMKNERHESIQDVFNSEQIKNIATLRSKFEDISDKPVTSISDVVGHNSKNVGILKERINRIRTISHKFRIFTDTIGGEDEFLFSITVRDPITGLVSEIFEFKIPHKINLENYYIPEFIPDISIIRSKPQKGISSINGIVSNVDWKIKNIKLSTRRITDDSSLSLSKFSKPRRVDSIKEIKNQNCYKVQNIGNLSSHQMSILRLTSETITGLNISNFSSDVVAGESFNYINSGIHAKTLKNGGGVAIKYYIESSNVAGVSVYRRLKGESKFVPARCMPSSLWGPEKYRNRDVLPNPPISQISKKNGSIAVVDIAPKNNQLVNYKLRLFLKNGGDHYGKEFSTIVNVEPLKIIRPKIGKITISSENRARFPIAKFNLEFEMHKSNTDKILSVLRDLGNENIFSSDVDITKDSLTDLCVLGVTRVNITTSQSEFLGYHPEGEFSDDGSNGSRLEQGQEYIYYVTAYLTNPDQVTKSYTASALENKNIISDIKQIRIPSSISKIQQSAARNLSDITPSGFTLMTVQKKEAFDTVKINKYFAPDTLARGIVSSAVNLSQDYNFGKFNTGDTAYKKIDLNNMEYDITGDTLTILTRSSSGAPVLRFGISSTGYSSISSIDYVVITCIRNGQETIAGACHSDQSGQFVFVDYTSNEYIGDIEYFATIVSVSGIIGKKKSIGSTTLHEMRPSKIKIKAIS